MTDLSPQLGFRFEHTRDVTEEDYVRLEYTPPRTRARGRVLLVFFALLGAALLFSPYTVAIGLFILIVVAGISTSRWWMRWGQRQSYAGYPHLHGRVTFGASNEGLWLRTPELHAFSGWANLVAWEERDGVLRLSPSGMTPVYLPVGELRDAGVYERVLDLARQHGTDVTHS